MDVAILAGGQGRRFGGRDKSGLSVGPTSIFDRQLDALRGLADRILVISNEPARYTDRGVEVVPDLLPGSGALGGIYTALTASRTPHVLVVACDLPFLRAPFLEALVALADDRFDVVVPRSPDGLQPLCAVYARRLLSPIRQRIEAGQLKILDVLTEARVREVGPDALAGHDADGALFFNVNTPADLERAVRLARPNHANGDR